MGRVSNNDQDIAQVSLKLQPTSEKDEIQTLLRLISKAIKKDNALFLFVRYQNFRDAQNMINVLQQKSDTGIKFISINCQSQNIQFLSPHLLQKQNTKTVFCIFNLPRHQDSQGAEIDPNFLENLNFTRDQLQEHKIKAIFFLTEYELSAVINKADDFWAFRHRLLELPEEIQHFINIWSRAEVSFIASNKEEIHRQIGYRKSLLDTVSSPEKKVSLINEIAQRYHLLGQYEKALVLLEEGLETSRKIGDKKGEGTILNNISQIYDARGDYDTALDYLNRSLKIRQEIEDKSGEGRTLNNISQIFKARGDYDTALDYLNRSLKIFKEGGNKYEEGKTLNNISQIYHAR
ncbi:MAG: tetratricopeptide repeat protein, partial [bacterium]